ncbi:MAG: GldG family protein [Vicinamibacterales bacterium]
MKRIANIIGWVGTVLVFAAVVVRFAKPDWDQYAIYGAWAGLACLVLYVLGQYRDILDYFQRRQARYGALASVSVLIVLGLLVAVNYLSARQNKRWDLTENQLYSLSDQTVKLLKGLDGPLKFVVFDRGDSLDRYKPVLTEYGYHSSNVSTEYVDADKKPVQAKQYNVETYGTIVLEYKGRSERATSASEQELGNALVKVITGEKKKVYFVQGHGEKDFASSARTGYSTVADALGKDNYGVEALVLPQVQDVPADASVVVIAGPTADFLQQEVEMLSRYLNRGGHLLALLDPPEKADAEMPLLESLLTAWSLLPGRDVVVDISGMGRLFGTDDASMPVAATYPPHPITEQFRMLTAFPMARSVTPGPAGARTARAIIETSPRSWAETDVKELLASGKVAMETDKGDRTGPIAIGAAVAAVAPDAEKADAAKAGAAKTDDDAKKPETRVALIGDSDFAANAYLGIQGNKDLFVNAVNWLAQQENLISIRPKDASDRRVTLTSGQQSGIFWLSLLLLPALALGAGVMTWARRK